MLPCGDEVRESGAGSCEAFQSHGKEFGFYFECHGGPLEDLHLRVTQASVLKSLHRICAESRFQEWDGENRKSVWEVNAVIQARDGDGLDKIVVVAMEKYIGLEYVLEVELPRTC